MCAKPNWEIDASKYECQEIEGKRVLVPLPVTIPRIEFVERQDVIEKALAAWMTIEGLAPLHFRLYGPPGVGKNAIVYRLAQLLGKDLYIINGHEELDAEDIACTAVMGSRNEIEYVASPIFAAVRRGGICFFDEIGKAPTAALDPLASLLDDRRSLTSVLAGIQLRATVDFLFCAALNEDEEEGLGLPGFIDERTRPAIHVGYPSGDILGKILRSHYPMAVDTWFRAFLHEYKDETVSARCAITSIGYAYRMALRDGNTDLGEKEVVEYLRRTEAEVDKRRTGKSADANLNSTPTMRGKDKSGSEDKPPRKGSRYVQ